MEITEQDAFKLGFLARCAEEKLTGQALEARLEKVAQFNKTAWGEGYLPGTLRSGLRDSLLAYGAALSLPVAASILGGGAVGYGVGNMVEPRISEDEIRAKELADTYRLYADKAKNRRKSVKYRAQRENQAQQSFDDVYSRV
jgi:hypothetical protein